MRHYIRYIYVPVQYKLCTCLCSHNDPGQSLTSLYATFTYYTNGYKHTHKQPYTKLMSATEKILLEDISASGRHIFCASTGVLCLPLSSGSSCAHFHQPEHLSASWGLFSDVWIEHSVWIHIHDDFLSVLRFICEWETVGLLASPNTTHHRHHTHKTRCCSAVGAVTSRLQ